MANILNDDVLTLVVYTLFESEGYSANGNQPNIRHRNRQLRALQLTSRQFHRVVTNASLLWDIVALDLSTFPVASQAEERLNAFFESHAKYACGSHVVLRLWHTVANNFWAGDHLTCNWCSQAQDAAGLPTIRLSGLNPIHFVDAKLLPDDFDRLFRLENLSKLKEVSWMRLQVPYVSDLNVGELLRRLGDMPRLENLCIHCAVLFRDGVDSSPPRFTQIRKLELSFVGEGDHKFAAQLLFYFPLLNQLVLRKPLVKTYRPNLSEPSPSERPIHHHLERIEFADDTAIVLMTALRLFKLPVLNVVIAEIHFLDGTGREQLKKEIEALFHGLPLHVDVPRAPWSSD